MIIDNELPIGYRRVLGFECDNNAMWRITGFHLRGSDTVRISFSVTAACNVFGCYQSASATDNYDLYAATSTGAKYLRYGGGAYPSTFAGADLDKRFDVVVTPTGTSGLPVNSTWTEQEFESENDLVIGSTTLTSSGSKMKGKYYSNFIVDGRLNIVPCERLSDGVLGYYDLIGNAFHGPYTGFDGAVSLGYDTSHEITVTQFLASESDFTSVANAIRTKGGTNASLSFPSGFVSAIGAIQTGGGGNASEPTEDDDVVFYDYDGSLLYSYSAEDFASLSAMPANPTHEGLTAQGWNWSLADAKSYVSTYGKLNIGQMYITDDGKTRIVIKLDSSRLTPSLGFAINGSAVIDWGDGSSTTTVTGTSINSSYVQSTSHEYSFPGVYTISISVTGTLSFCGSNTNGSKVLWKEDSARNPNIVYQTAIRHVHIGDNTVIDMYAFSYCFSLLDITFPNGLSKIGSYAFSNCFSLKALIFPSGIGRIEGPTNTCRNLRSISIPNGVTYLGNFSGCSSIKKVTMPESITGNISAMFTNCSSLELVTIPNGITGISSLFSSCSTIRKVVVPALVTNIDAAFSSCYCLNDVNIPSGVTSIGNNTFSGCPFTSIELANTITNLGNNAFSGCTSLQSIKMPNGLTKIGTQTFHNCSSLAEITIPENVTSIGSKAFLNCHGLGSIKFEPSSPPALTSSDSLSGLPTDCIIYVPSGSLSDYTTATNYPSSSTYTYVEY